MEAAEPCQQWCPCEGLGKDLEVQIELGVLALGSVPAQCQVTLTGTDMPFIFPFLSEADTKHVNIAKKLLKT